MPSIEIRHAFTRPWRILLVNVPLLAAITAGILVAGSVEPTYQATGVLSITEFGQGDTPAAVRSLTDELANTLDSDTVTAAVREVAPSTNGKILSTPLGEGGGVEVAIVGDDDTDVEAGLDTGVRDALSIMSEVERRRVSRELTAADREAADSSQRLQEIESLAGAADLQQEAQRRSADLLTLRNQIAAAANEPIVQQALRATQREKQAELAAIDALLLEWNDVRVSFDLAVRAGADASLRLQQISTVQSDLTSQPLLQSVKVTESSTVPDLARAIVAAAVLAAAMVVGLAVLFGGRRRGPRRQRRRRTRRATRRHAPIDSNGDEHGSDVVADDAPDLVAADDYENEYENEYDEYENEHDDEHDDDFAGSDDHNVVTQDDVHVERADVSATRDDGGAVAVSANDDDDVTGHPIESDEYHGEYDDEYDDDEYDDDEYEVAHEPREFVDVVDVVDDDETVAATSDDADRSGDDDAATAEDVVRAVMARTRTIVGRSATGQPPGESRTDGR